MRGRCTRRVCMRLMTSSAECHLRTERSSSHRSRMSATRSRLQDGQAHLQSAAIAFTGDDSSFNCRSEPGKLILAAFVAGDDCRSCKAECTTEGGKESATVTSRFGPAVHQDKILWRNTSKQTGKQVPTHTHTHTYTHRERQSLSR